MKPSLREAGFDPESVSKAMAAGGLSVVTAANSAGAAARAQLEQLKADPLAAPARELIIHKTVVINVTIGNSNV